VIEVFGLLLGGMIFGIGVLRANAGYDYARQTPQAGSGGLCPLGLMIALGALVWALWPM
jgi:hypothetical protein